MSDNYYLCNCCSKAFEEAKFTCIKCNGYYCSDKCADFDTNSACRYCSYKDYKDYSDSMLLSALLKHFNITKVQAINIWRKGNKNGKK